MAALLAFPVASAQEEAEVPAEEAPAEEAPAEEAPAEVSPPDVECAVPVPADAPPPRPAPFEDTLATAHQFATGAGVKVAVIDTGVTPHEELTVTDGGDLITPDTPTGLFDCDGHGTVVAGIIAGRTTGVAPDAEVISIRQSSGHYRNDDPNTQQPDPNDPAAVASGTVGGLAQAVNMAIDQQARVINISVVACLPPSDAERVDWSALNDALHRAEESGAVVVAAAGNVSAQCPQGSTVVPSHSDTVVAVGAHAPGEPHQLTDYSVMIDHSALALSAAGRVEVSPSPSGEGWSRGLAQPNGGDAAPFEGTSFAAPVVSGVAALLVQRYPFDSPAQIRGRLEQVAQPSTHAIDTEQVLAAVTYPVGDPIDAPTHHPTIADTAAESRSARNTSALVIGSILLAAVAAQCLRALFRGVFPRRSRRHSVKRAHYK